MTTPRRDPHAEHNLWLAYAPTFSLDGRWVYVVCGCERLRRVSVAEWEDEEARRQEAVQRQRQREGSECPQ